LATKFLIFCLVFIAIISNDNLFRNIYHNSVAISIMMLNQQQHANDKPHESHDEFPFAMLMFFVRMPERPCSAYGRNDMEQKV